MVFGGFWCLYFEAFYCFYLVSCVFVLAVIALYWCEMALNEQNISQQVWR